LDAWVDSGIADTALPDKTSDALNALDSLDTRKFPNIFFEYIEANEDSLLSGFKALLGDDLDPRVVHRLDVFMLGTEEEDSLKMRLQKLLEELSKERKTHNQRKENIRKQITELKRRPQDEAAIEDIEQLERERRKAMEGRGRALSRRGLETPGQGPQAPTSACRHRQQGSDSARG